MSSIILSSPLSRGFFKLPSNCYSYVYRLNGQWTDIATGTRFLSLLTSNSNDDEHHYRTPFLSRNSHRSYRHPNVTNYRTVYNTNHMTRPVMLSRLPQQCRWVHGTGIDKEEDQSVMERAVTTLKKKKQDKATQKQSQKEIAQVKPPILVRVKDGLIHYYHGFRLFFLDIRIACRLLWKSASGSPLSRREYRQFRRTAGDLFRMLPFSVFVVIPFMEFLLPVYLYLFPNALPSTFQTESTKKARKQKELKVKLQMAKFLQDTIEEMTVSSKNPKKQEAVENFANFFKKIRTTGAQADTAEILKFSKLFQNEMTLDNLSQKQLQALCRLVVLPTIGSSQLLRLQLQMKMRQIKADDKMILKEGVDSLTTAELQGASQARGMRALGMPIERLKSQLQQWVELHLKEEIPLSLLLFSRALYLPEDVPTSDVLKEALTKLPEQIVDEAEVLVASTAGEIVDNRTRADIVREQERRIKEEEKETKGTEKKKKGVSKDTVVSMGDTSEEFSPKEIQDLSQAVSSLKPKLEEEREVLREIKEDREEYREDIADLALECSDGEDNLQESVVSKRLGKKVEAMLEAVDTTLNNLERGYVSQEVGMDIQKQEDESITLQQLESALTQLQGSSCEAKHKSLFSVLDEDHDGNINLDEMAEIIEALATEGTGISPEQIAEIKKLIKLEGAISEPQQRPSIIATQTKL